MSANMSTKKRSRRGSSPQSGFALAEALVSVLVVAIGMLGIAQMNVAAVDASAQANARTLALDLAEQKIEQMRNLGDLAVYQALANSTAPEVFARGSATFSRTWTLNKVTTANAPQYTEVTMTVSWQDSDGVTQSVTLTSNIAESEPAKSVVCLGEGEP